MSQPRQNKMMSPRDTTYTKIFVGGLAWETKRDSLKRYFDQFGEIIEAVVIAERSTGRSKGYGFVIFKDPNSATIACQNPYPVIDGRRANCNIAAIGAQKTDPSITGRKKFHSPSWNNVPIQFQGPSTYYNHHIPQYAYQYPLYRYPGYPRPQDHIHEMDYYNAYGGQQLPFHYFPAYYQPFYGLSRQFVPTAYLKKTQFPEMPPQEFKVGIPEPISPSPSIPNTRLITETEAATGVLRSPQEQKSSA